ncbi:uncharacterized protein K452DRAFT_350056 [Aplosporella prunicola CBS 121167]|uniref:2,6-dihydroxypyridine 3-monooxygenase substrate binding domain-containing protein n=1 Tax=Aplosporella prunicola CBS 121167 TaxID=1176127 RepID=A0A6A6BL47_9PEZI|nr:uncharacterized protein K452DRAFT_350056 [Aplosporella prunicola CBS 121167]KAF2143587.1 hypothetical protein K452DRAFT_350056 [Aplosporella prunicola CBS 121167]
MSKTLNIVGGSLGGLFHGIALSRLGHRVTILEQNPAPLLHDQGAGIVAGSNTQKYFRAHDRSQTPLAITSNVRQYLDHKGNVIETEKRAQKMTSWDLLYHVLRANYDGVQSKYLEPPKKKEGDGDVKYAYGRVVNELQDLGTDRGVRVTSRSSKDGTEETIVADLLIASDGASSTIRTILQPDVQRTYAGYVAWRGTCPESELSGFTASTLVDKFTFFHQTGMQILAYLIPGPAGTLEKGKRLMNWVWYCNCPQDSAEYMSMMLDNQGKRHNFSLPPGRVRPEVWEEQKKHAERELPPQFAEIVRKTKVPFLQAITDVISPKASFFNGKILLVGDAVAGFRPHAAASTSQAAFDSFYVVDLVTGRISLSEWEKNVMGYAREIQPQSVALGQRSQFGEHPLRG